MALLEAPTQDISNESKWYKKMFAWKENINFRWRIRIIFSQFFFQVVSCHYCIRQLIFNPERYGNTSVTSEFKRLHCLMISDKQTKTRRKFSSTEHQRLLPENKFNTQRFKIMSTQFNGYKREQVLIPLIVKRPQIFPYGMSNTLKGLQIFWFKKLATYFQFQ